MRALWIVVCAGAGLYGQAVQRTIKENHITRGSEAKAAPDTTAPAPGQALESIFASSEDLNAIRDGYLRRLSGDGCPTDVAIHVAELRARLRDLESDSAAETVAKPKTQSLQTSAEMELALQALAATWKNRGLAETMRPASSRESDQAKLLKLVLPAGDAQGAAVQQAGAAQLRAEISRLMDGCKVMKP